MLLSSRQETDMSMRKRIARRHMYARPTMTRRAEAENPFAKMEDAIFEKIEEYEKDFSTTPVKELKRRKMEVAEDIETLKVVGDKTLKALQRKMDVLMERDDTSELEAVEEEYEEVRDSLRTLKGPKSPYMAFFTRINEAIEDLESSDDEELELRQELFDYKKDLRELKTKLSEDMSKTRENSLNVNHVAGLFGRILGKYGIGESDAIPSEALASDLRKLLGDLPDTSALEEKQSYLSRLQPELKQNFKKFESMENRIGWIAKESYQYSFEREAEQLKKEADEIGAIYDALTLAVGVVLRDMPKAILYRQKIEGKLREVENLLTNRGLMAERAERFVSESIKDLERTMSGSFAGPLDGKRAEKLLETLKLVEEKMIEFSLERKYGKKVKELKDELEEAVKSSRGLFSRFFGRNAADFMSDDYMSDDLEADDYMSDDYMSDDYMSDDYMSDDFMSDDLEAEDYMSDDLEADDYMSGDLEAEDYMSDDYMGSRRASYRRSRSHFSESPRNRYASIFSRHTRRRY
jgi:hypothetical protein